MPKPRQGLDIDSISSTNDFDLVLQKLRNSPYIIRLGLRCSNLHDADLDDIATMKQLQELYLSNNDLSSQDWLSYQDCII